MSHAMVTIIAPIELEQVRPLAMEIGKLENPARADIRALLDERDGEDGTHFVSMHAVPSPAGKRGHLVLEFSADGTPDRALKRIVKALGSELKPIFSDASDCQENLRSDEELESYLRKHVVEPGHGWFDPPGICFAGTPGMSVGRIKKEAQLAAKIAKLLGDQSGDRHAIDRLDDVRAKLANGDDAWALKDATAPFAESPASPWDIALPLALQAVRIYLWPIVLIVAVLSIIMGVSAAWTAGDLETAIIPFLGAALQGFVVLAVVAAIVVAIVLYVLYKALRQAEEHDWVGERRPDPATLNQIFARENHSAQNHMISVTERKPGLVRAITLRGVFWIIGEFAARVYRPGFLSGIGTIHFARWVTAPGTRDLLFLSNYGGSWESYLEDFITRANYGLTGVWSNTIGFPRTSNLIFEGAANGEEFKRYARQSMYPTPFWYSAYPKITTSHVRTNAGIRRGLATALTNEEAQRWLALFGSAQRPDFKLESSDIQSLLFGGLGFLPCGVALFFDLPADRDRAQRWLAEVASAVAFNDGRRLDGKAAITIGLGPAALPKLGLPQECVATFPAAFLDGMPNRARILGDTGDNEIGNWWWGKTTPDVVLLVYGEEDGDVSALKAQIAALGLTPVHRVPLTPIVKKGEKKEPFGFVDGISQPLIRGTYKALRERNQMHVVAPGEFVIGYPDNRDHIPPGPTLSPLLDPDNVLPIAAPSRDFAVNIVDQPRDVARNGAFLVIRQLEQHVRMFDDYCTAEADRLKLKNRLAPPYQIDAHFIGAKLVGRWKDGSSLVRHPYMTAKEEIQGTQQVAELEEKRSHSKTAAARAHKPDEGHAKHAEAKSKDEHCPPPPKEPPQPDNNFLFGVEDPEGVRCPYGAHIRRANPRESFDPGSDVQIGITNRHRLLRVGRLYEPQRDQEAGLLFMCINGDIERQFEFIQQTWLDSPTFHGLVGEQDPLVGSCTPVGTGFVIPTRDGPMQLNPLKPFVTTRGGGYFFMPGRRLLRFLSGGHKPSGAVKPRQRATRARAS